MRPTFEYRPLLELDLGRPSQQSPVNVQLRSRRSIGSDGGVGSVLTALEDTWPIASATPRCKRDYNLFTLPGRKILCCENCSGSCSRLPCSPGPPQEL